MIIQQRANLILIGFAIATGLIVSLISWLELCTTACAEGHKYRLFGLPFAAAGFCFFSTAGCLLALSIYDRRRLLLLKLLVASAIGAELYFLYVQKYLIGRWCPICLAIFGCVVAIALLLSVNYLENLRQALQLKSRSQIMKSLTSGLNKTVPLFLLGFVAVFFGVTSPESAFGEAIDTDTVYFGKKSSPVEVYVFTDWFCPACRRAESAIEQNAPDIAKHARLFFIDIPIHEESLNFLPYNLSFMIKEKGKYLKLRHRLTELSLQSKTPTDEQVEKLAEAVGTRYQPLDYPDVNAGRSYFEETAKKYGVDSTPTIIIVNPSAKKEKKLSGVKEITQADFLALIKSLETEN